jgi:hypothetical protein
LTAGPRDPLKAPVVKAPVVKAPVVKAPVVKAPVVKTPVGVPAGASVCPIVCPMHPVGPGRGPDGVGCGSGEHGDRGAQGGDPFARFGRGHD